MLLEVEICCGEREPFYIEMSTGKFLLHGLIGVLHIQTALTRIRKLQRKHSKWKKIKTNTMLDEGDMGEVEGR